MKKLIKELKEQLKEYESLVADYEEQGLENLSLEDTETYGVYKGKAEMLETLIPKLESLNK